MPASVMIGLLSLLLAVVLYSVGVWGAIRRRGFGRSQVIVLWFGAAFDLLATASMASTIGGLDLSATGWLHTVLALVAMVGMIGFASVGTYSFIKGNDGLARNAARLIAAPWLVWVAVFVWGMATRMPRR